MDYWKRFRVRPGDSVHLSRCDPAWTDPGETKRSAEAKTERLRGCMDELQFRLYAEQKRSLLICLQGMDASGKDGTVRHVIGCLNPQGCRVVSFKQPTAEERAHDFLWRIEREAPRRGEIVVFNRSHYEDVLVVRVHGLVPKKEWKKRYEEINAFERRLREGGIHILKFFLHISKGEQLRRFERRLDDPRRRWKISEDDYREREFWGAYRRAHEEALSRCSLKEAPWFVIPSDHKWFRDLAIARIVVEEMRDMGIHRPKPTVDLADIRRKYHQAAKEERP